MNSNLRTRLIGLMFVLACLVTHQNLAFADGSETLGPPSIQIAEGSGVVAKGTGMLVQPGLIELEVPGTVVQALLYWEGFASTNGEINDSIIINGTTEVFGLRIGGPDYFFYDSGVPSDAWSSTYRADITLLNLIQSGPNSISLSGLDFSYVSNGAGLLVIYEDGTTTNIELRDGNDLAFGRFPSPRDTTVPQTFTFAASAEDRVAYLTMFFSSVDGPASGEGPIRPTVIEINTGGQTYFFDDLLTSIDGDEWGTYRIDFTIPAGATSLTVQARSEDRIMLPGAPLVASFVWNGAALTIPELEVCSGRIGDYVWYDGNTEDSDDIQDGNDTGIPNVTVNLLDAAMNIIATTTTDANGFYEFTADDAGAPLCAGEYFVDVVEATLPMGYSPVDPNGGGNPAANDANDSNGPLDGGAAPVSLPTDSSEDVTIDFGYLSACSGEIGDYLWYDGNAVERNDIQDLDDTGLDGITVILKDSMGTQIATTVSGPNGFYKFSGLCAGDYTVEVDETTLPPGYSPVSPFGGTNPEATAANDSNGSPASVNLPADDSSDVTIDFGYYSDCSGLIGDFVWHDLNRNGIQDAGEPGIDGVRLVLTNSSDEQVAETTSGPNGAYEFGGLCADDYTVTIDPSTVPLGFTPTLTGEGTVETDSSDSPVSVPLPMDDSVDETVDFGYITPCEGVIGDYVWDDTNRDGLQGDPMDEPGFANYPVVLKDGTTMEVLQETTTDDFGFYQFMGLCAGDYIVEVATPDGYEPTQMVGGMPALDSNGSPAMVTLPADDATDETIDFGFRELPDPSIDIRKQEEGPDSRTFVPGSDVTFEIVVKNTGNTTLIGVKVTDDLALDCEQNPLDLDGILSPGEEVSYFCSSLNVTSPFNNEACVSGTDEETEAPVSDCDTSEVDLIDIDIRKQAEGPDLRTFASGTDVTFEIEVTNTGSVDLAGVVVTDVLAPACDKDIGFLAAGDSVTYECTIPGLDASLDNEICVEGTESGGQLTTEDCDPSDVEIIDIDIRKQAEGPDSRNFNVGDDVTFEIMVTNTGDETLMNVMVTDPLEPDCDKLIGTMNPGDTDTYECTTTNLAAGYTNVATVTGERNGVSVSDEDPSTVMISGINIRKQEEGPDSRTFIRGSDVTFEIMVTNTGETDLSNVAVSDPLVPDCDNTIGFLGAGDSVTYSCTIPNTMGSFTNEACVTGENGTPTPLEDCDPSDVEIIDIDIRKQAEGDDTRVFAFGADVDFEIVVTNTGDEDLVNVNVTDPLLPACDKSIGPLAAGASDTYTCTAFGVMSGFNNIAGVTGERNGVQVSDEDPSRIALVGIDIRKQAEGPDSRTFASGADVNFEIVVTNTGILLQNVEVTDAAAPGCGMVIGDLPTGGVFTYSCTAPGVTDSFTNEACVTGTRAGVQVSDCDPSDVEIIDIDIRKQAEGPDSQTVNPGDPVTWTIVVTNTGDEDLSDVMVTDVLAPACDMFIGNLAAGESQSYPCTLYEFDAGFTNEACVEGSRNGVTVEDCDPSTVVIPEPCGLTVDKLCFVPPPPPSSNFACAKPIDSLTMIWTGQDDVTVKAWKGPVGSTLLDTITNVMNGDEVMVNGYAGSPNDVFWEIFDSSGTKIGESKFHLSCSDDDMDGPEDCGKLQGNGKDNSSSLLNLWELEGMIDTLGTLDCTVNDDPDIGDFLQACEYVDMPGASCETEDKPKSLTFRYTPSDCSTTNPQEGNYECSGGTLSGDATFALTDDEDKYTYVPADGMLEPGDLITITSIGNDFESNFRFELVGNTTQTYEIHTSCSKALAVGDVFGSMELVGYNGKMAGQAVEYAYQVYNNGPGTVTNILVDDDKLGVIDSGFQLEADTGMTLYAQAFLEATTTNTVTVTGTNASTAACFAQDSVTITAVEPPNSCALNGKPTALEFTLGSGLCSDTSNTQDGKAKCSGGGKLDDIDTVTMTKDANKFVVNIVGDTFSIAYDNPAGDKLPSTIKFRVRDSDGTSHDYELHTSCSQPLAEGDVFGGLELTGFVPVF